MFVFGVGQLGRYGLFISSNLTLAYLLSANPQQSLDEQGIEQLPDILPVNGSVEEDSAEVVDDPASVLAHVQLARTPRKLVIHSVSTDMLNGKETEGQRRAQTVLELADEINVPNLADHIQQFLFEQFHPHDTRDHSEVPLAQRPHYTGRISVFNSASSTFYAPSDLSGIGGMTREHIRSCPAWRNEHSRKDCVFVITGDSNAHGM